MAGGVEITSRLLAAASDTLAAPLAEALENQRETIRRLAADLAQARTDRGTAERQVRDMARENDRLRAENARLRSLAPSTR